MVPTTDKQYDRLLSWLGIYECMVMIVGESEEGQLQRLFDLDLYLQQRWANKNE